MIKRLFASKIIRNAGWLVGGKIAQMLINLIVGLLTARYLGPSNFGLINYAGAFTAFFSAFCTLGINSVLVREFFAYPDREGQILGTSLFLRAVSSFLSAAMIIGIVGVIDAGERDTVLVVALSCIGMVFHIFEVFNYWFQSRLQSRVTALCALAAFAVMAAYKVYLLAAGKNVIWFALSTSVDYICIGGLLLLAYRKHGGGRLQVSLTYGKELLNRSKYFILPTLMVAIYAQTDKIMLKQMLGEEQIGYYATAISLSTVWCFVLQAIIDSLYPSVMEASGKNEALFEKRNRQLYAAVFYIAMAASLAITLLAEWIIRLLYGDVYLPAAAPLRIIVWYTAFSYLGVARNAWIVCKGRQKYLLPVYGFSAASNVVLNILLIPGLGTTGAAIASLCAQIMTTMVVPFAIPALRDNARLMMDAIMLHGIRNRNSQ